MPHFRGRRVDIRVTSDFKIGDEETFITHLKHELAMQFFILYKDENYSIEYMFRTVDFEVVCGEHVVPPGIFTAGRLEDVGYLITSCTQLKMYRESATDVELMINIYEKELEHVEDMLKTLFQHKSTTNEVPEVIEPISHPISCSCVRTTHLSDYFSAACEDSVSTFNDDTFTDLASSMSACTLESSEKTLRAEFQDDCNIQKDLSTLSLNNSNQDISVSLSIIENNDDIFTSPTSTIMDDSSAPSDTRQDTSSLQSPILQPPPHDSHPASDANIKSTNTSSGKLIVVLIIAPSGCGKTFLLDRFNKLYTAVWYRKPISNITTVFELAKEKAPCLVLIDDVDKISDTALLVTLLHELPAGVSVIATASDVTAVPAELRRLKAVPLVVNLPRPDAQKRKTLLAAHSAKLDLQFDGDALSELSDRSHGATARDITEMSLELWSRCSELGCVTSAQILPVLDAFRAKNSQNTQDQNTRQQRDKKRTVQPIVHGYKEAFMYIEQRFKATLEKAEFFAETNMSPPSRILLYGPPGCGKTFLTKALAQKYSLSIRTITRADVFSKYFGESEAKLDQIFNEVMSSVPCILHFPGFDGLAGCKGDEQHEVEGRVVNLLKARMDGAIKLTGLFVVAETSRPHLLDTAIIRRGRFHGYLHIGLPVDSDRRELLSHRLATLQLSEQQLQEMVHLTQGYTMAEVQNVCRAVLDEGCDQLQQTAMSVQPSTSQKLLNKISKFAEFFI